MSHTREEEWKQVRALHLVRDERDREVGAAAKGRAGDAVLAASQLFAAACLLRGDPAWAAFLSLTFVGGGAQCLHRFWEDRERFFLICGLAASACGAALGCWYLLQDPGTGPSLGRLAAFALLISLLTSLSGLILVPLLLGAVWLKYKVGRMDGEAWEHYFQSVSTVGLLLRGGVLLLLALGLMLDTFKKAGFDFARYSEITCKDVPQEIMDDILNILLEEKQIVKINDEMYTLTSYMETAKEKIREHLKEDPLITIAQVRDMFATSRKSAKPILEYMDSIKVTKKTGAESERVAY